jgi:polyphosphate kinase 2 (PPK2 family)
LTAVKAAARCWCDDGISPSTQERAMARRPTAKPPVAKPRATPAARKPRSRLPAPDPIPTPAAAAVAQAEAEAWAGTHAPPAVPPMGIAPAELGVPEATAREMEAMPVTAEESTSAPLPAGYPYRVRLRRREYEAEKKKLQIELLKVQSWVKETGQKHRDAVRGPRRRRQGRHHQALHRAPQPARGAGGRPGEAQRARTGPVVLPALHPAPADGYGEMVLFDRSWYNRAGVERVMGFCTPAEYLEFMRQTPRVRAHARAQQRRAPLQVLVLGEPRRTAAALHLPPHDPLKHWKLSPIDVSRWTSGTTTPRPRTPCSSTPTPPTRPWLVIKSDDKKRARLNCMRHVLSTLPYPGKDPKVAYPADPLIVGSAANVLAADGQ